MFISFCYWQEVCRHRTARYPYRKRNRCDWFSSRCPAGPALQSCSSNSQALPDTHPEAHVMLSQGDFGVQRNATHGFTQVSVDQTIEQTLNRNTKTKGGIVGFILKKGAVQRWVLMAHMRAQFVDRCREMAGCHEKSRNHKEHGAKRMMKYEEDVRNTMEVIRHWRNPFEPSDELVSLSTGSVASTELTKDLLEAKKKRREALALFNANRLSKSDTG
ncbi:uncharacterized protein LOC125563185 [Nematostella vectensis]|uniref:uncharacterized protein LOC125563185 n=1 Tax=Nematostella vectensis TaxID=45351 RepID=UPI0020777275|nr:uncharacterized protein LOC125563185 [Nematostella vectensis]